MWSAQIELERSNESKPLLGELPEAALRSRLQKISILSSQQQITYLEATQLWQQEKSFRSFWMDLLLFAPFSAYFWETPPVSLSSVHQPFEFVLVNSPQLARKSSTPSHFQEYFESASPEQEIVTFSNLGTDAQLVVPCPRASESVYTHLAKFVREAPQSQQHQLWQTLGREI